jgi:Predicted sugar phosphatases of the HAD superfamily
MSDRDYKNMDFSEAKALLKRKKLFIFDMDGTIYLGGRPFDFAIRFIKRLRSEGKRILFFTNNASHSTEFYYTKLEKLGFEPQPGEIMTSGDVTAVYLTRHEQNKKVYLVGTPELETVFRNAGINVIGENEDGSDIVVTSFDTTLTYAKLEAACRYIRSGAEFLCTHPDFNCPTEDGFIPDSGAIAALVTASTNVLPTYFGKPYAKTAEMISEFTQMPKDDMCIFGDRLYTDIATGKQHGITAILVLTGETTAEDLKTTAEADYPDIVFESLAETDSVMG